MRNEINDENFATWLATATECKNLAFMALDLRPYDEQLAALPQATQCTDSCSYFGCELGPRLAAAATHSFALVIPRFTGFEFEAFRTRLYSVSELFDQPNYRDCKDYRIFASYMQLDETGHAVRPPRLRKVGPDELLARRMHDHFIGAELNELLAQHTAVVAIMGGHDVARGAATYVEIALLARQLALQGMLVVSGGGPGLMEAANLGPYLAGYPEGVVHSAVNLLREEPLYTSPGWLAAGMRVRHEFPRVKEEHTISVGIPTWWYGHEPPNVFASHIAKYFENSLREEGMLAVATHGIVFGDGNAGTVQEIFQDACQNYYQTYGYASPMILYGKSFWEALPDPRGAYPVKAKPAWQLLKHLARVGGFEDRIHLTDDRHEAYRILTEFRPPA